MATMAVLSLIAISSREPLDGLFKLKIKGEVEVNVRRRRNLERTDVGQESGALDFLSAENVRRRYARVTRRVTVE